MTEVEKNNVENEESEMTSDIMMLLALNIREIFQNARIHAKNDIRNVVRKINENIGYHEVEDKKEKKKYDTYSDAKIKTILDEMVKEGKITEDVITKIQYIEVASQTSDIEMDKICKKEAKEYIENNPIYINFLSKIKGIGKIYSAKLLARLGDCGRFHTVSRLFAYTGNHVVDGKAPKRQKGKDANWNHRLRSLTYMISENLMKQNKGVYRGMYVEYKDKQLKKEYPEGELFKKYGKSYKKEDTHLTKGHAHNQALRKIRKLFLSHYWECAREVNGLPTEKTYVEGVLNHTHIIDWKEAVDREDELLS